MRNFTQNSSEIVTLPCLPLIEINDHDLLLRHFQTELKGNGIELLEKEMILMPVKLSDAHFVLIVVLNSNTVTSDEKKAKMLILDPTLRPDPDDALYTRHRLQHVMIQNLLVHQFKAECKLNASGNNFPMEEEHDNILPMNIPDGEFPL